MTKFVTGFEALAGLSVRNVIDMRARETPGAIFLIDPGNDGHVTYQALARRVCDIASRIAAHGVQPGESVAYGMSNSADTAIAILAIMYGGYRATAINLVAGNDAIAYAIQHSETKLLLADGGGRATVGEAMRVAGADMPPVFSNSSANANTINGPGTGRINGVVTHASDGLLMYTSGTTGRPKGVVHSHASLLAGGANTARAHALKAGDRGLCVLPFYHINGLCVTLMGSLVAGGSLVVPAKFSVSTFWALIGQYGCSWFSVVPTQISYLLHDATPLPAPETLKNLRFGRSASAPLSPDVQAAFETRFSLPIIETMGLTETAAQILSNPLPPATRKIGSPGRAVGNEAMIGDPSQKEVPRGTEGELLIRGPNVMRYYLKNEEATAQALTADGWLRTGDLGRMDDDGFVFITGRLKELIIKGGENIAPREIDEALYTHSDVIEAAAFSRKCPRYGETVDAAVMLAAGSRLTEADLIALCVERVGKFKAPERVLILAELPKGPSGKIQRRKLAELAQA